MSSLMDAQKSLPCRAYHSCVAYCMVRSWLCSTSTKSRAKQASWSCHQGATAVEYTPNGLYEFHLPLAQQEFSSFCIAFVANSNHLLLQSHNTRAHMQHIAGIMRRWSKGGASPERMYRTLTDATYQKATNKHGRRLRDRNQRPSHILATYALLQRPGHKGNIQEMAEIIRVRLKLYIGAQLPLACHCLLHCFQSGQCSL